MLRGKYLCQTCARLILNLELRKLEMFALCNGRSHEIRIIYSNAIEAKRADT
jgi:hypothetical protein